MNIIKKVMIGLLALALIVSTGGLVLIVLVAVYAVKKLVDKKHARAYMAVFNARRR